jgi:large subunit ribosomal protein L1
MRAASGGRVNETARVGAKLGKRFATARTAVPVGVKFAPDEAVKLVKELAFAKFEETVEVATRLGVDPRKADQIVRGTVVLPHGTGKTARVLVIAQGDKAIQAEEAGADYVGVEFIDKIKGGWLDCVDKTGNVHAPIGKVSFSQDQLSDNLGAFMEQIVRAKPSAAKGTYVRSVTVSSTMGPGVAIDPNLYRRA